jgi:polysaccharide export outer membrane protein
VFRGRFGRFAGASLLAGLSAGCAVNTPPLTGGEVKVLDRVALPVPQSAPGRSALAIAPLDRLTVTVFNAPELGVKDAVVGTDGTIAVPLVGSVKASGKTVDQLALEIERGLRGNYVRNPQVSVNISEFRNRTFAIDGAVVQPGQYSANTKTTLMEAVAMAHGLTETAKIQNVVVFRTVGDQHYAALYNLGAVRQGIYADPQIYPGDVITVGESATRRIYKDALQLLPALASPVIVLLQN